MYIGLRVLNALLSSDIKGTWNTLDRLSKNTQKYQTSLNMPSGSGVVSCGQTDRQT